MALYLAKFVNQITTTITSATLIYHETGSRYIEMPVSLFFRR
jgi:hypothetical protein